MMTIKDAILFSLRYNNNCKQKGFPTSIGNTLLALSLGEQTIEEISGKVNNSKDGMNCVMRQVKTLNLAFVSNIEKKGRAKIPTWKLTKHGEDVFKQLISK